MGAQRCMGVLLILGTFYQRGHDDGHAVLTTDGHNRDHGYLGMTTVLTTIHDE